MPRIERLGLYFSLPNSQVRDVEYVTSVWEIENLICPYKILNLDCLSTSLRLVSSKLLQENSKLYIGHSKNRADYPYLLKSSKLDYLYGCAKASYVDSQILAVVRVTDLLSDEELRARLENHDSAESAYRSFYNNILKTTSHLVEQNLPNGMLKTTAIRDILNTENIQWLTFNACGFGDDLNFAALVGNLQELTV